MRSIHLTACAVALALSSPVAASIPPSVDEIVSRYVAARGGYEKLKAIRTLIFRGVYREGDYSSPRAAMSLMRPYLKLVGDAEAPNPDFAEGYDGSAWEYYGDPGVVLRTVGAASAAGRHATAIDGPLVDYRERGWRVAVAGVETIAGRSAYRLKITMPDGFEQEEFIDAETWLLVAERKAAPIHAFGQAVATEERIEDYRPVAGVLFPFSRREVEIASGKTLNEIRWTTITANRELDPKRFSPPEIERTPAQRLYEQLFAARSDAEAVMWSYRDFRRAYPEIDLRAGLEFIGFQMVKFGDTAAALALLRANASDHPGSATSAFGFARAHRAAGDIDAARAELRRALALDPTLKRAADLLRELGEE
jgi:hypothetical protein